MKWLFRECASAMRKSSAPGDGVVKARQWGGRRTLRAAAATLMLALLSGSVGGDAFAAPKRSTSRSASQGNRAVATTTTAARSAGAGAATARTQPSAALTEKIRKEIAELGPGGGVWGVYVAESDAQRPIVDIGGELLLLPASNRKLFSTALALRRLGAGYQFTTRVWALGTVQADGTLDGDLVLQAAGDPTLRPRFLGGSAGSALLAKWAREVKAAGITKVNGRVLVDSSIYEDPSPMPPGWAWDQLLETYGSIPSALAMNENRVDVTVRPGGGAGQLVQATSAPSFDTIDLFENHALTVSSSSRKTLRLSRSTSGASIALIGGFPQGAPPETLSTPLPDPTGAWGERFGDALTREGVKFSGHVKVSRQPVAPAAAGPKAKVLVAHKSPALDDIAAWTNKESDNHCAEMLFLAAGADYAGQASYATAQAAERVYLSSIGVTGSLIECEDGSGLGRTDKASPRAIVTLLIDMQKSNVAKEFVASLPTAGIDGTLRGRMDDPDLKGRVHAKTGTLRDVTALSGYLYRPDGRKLSFSIICNFYSYKTPTIRAKIDQICAMVMEAPLN